MYKMFYFWHECTFSENCLCSVNSGPSSHKELRTILPASYWSAVSSQNTKIKHQTTGDADLRVLAEIRNRVKYTKDRKHQLNISHHLSSQPPRRVLRHLPLSVQEQLPSSPWVSVLQPAPEHLPCSSHDSPILPSVLQLCRVLLPQSVKSVTG